jgi:hypothetical protein
MMNTIVLLAMMVPAQSETFLTAEDAPTAADMRAREIIAEVRARQIIADVQANTDPLQQAPARTTYLEMYRQAVKQNMPLIVLVQQPEVVKDAAYLYWNTDSFGGVNRVATIISRPINGQLWWIITQDKYDPVEVKKVLDAPTSTFTPTAPPVQQYYVPHVQAYPMNLGMMFDSCPT